MPNPQALIHLLLRLHFCIGLFISTFIFIAALTGTLCVQAPQRENHRYAHQRLTDLVGVDRPLLQQVTSAINQRGSDAARFFQSLDAASACSSMVSSNALSTRCSTCTSPPAGCSIPTVTRNG